MRIIMYTYVTGWLHARLHASIIMYTYTYTHLVHGTYYSTMYVHAPITTRPAGLPCLSPAGPPCPSSYSYELTIRI